MTEELAATENEKTSRARKFILPVAVAIVALLVVGYLVSQSGLDKAVLRQRIDAFATSLAEKGKQEGRDIQLTYKDIAIDGSFSSRHAVIIEPQLSVKPLAAEGKAITPKDNLILRTAQISIFPKAVDMSKLNVVIDKPIEFFDGSDDTRKLLTITSATPFEALVNQHKQSGQAYLEITHAVPSDIQMTYLREQQVEGEEEATPTVVPVYETIKLTQASGGHFRSNLAQDGTGLGEVELKLSELALVPEAQPEGAIRIADVSGTWKHALNETGLHVVDAQLHIGDIVAPTEVVPYAPIALTMDASYEGAAPQTAADVASIRAQESSIKLRKFALTTKDASLKATADFVASPTDILPVGMANLSLTNVPFVLGELRKYGFLNRNNEPFVRDVLELATGTPMNELTDASIDINRIRGGSFAIGKTTFEELFAVVLKNAMTRRPAPTEGAAPVEPIEQKDAPAKMEIEEGARG